MKVKNRWLIALSAVGIHISIGSVYAYSVMVYPLNKLLGWEKSSISLAFSVAILCLGLSAAFLGKWVEKIQARKAGSLAALLYGIGIAGTGLAVNLASLKLFIIAYGVIAGIGLGIAYITPVSTLMKWFPDKKGLAAGIAIMGFGFSAMVFGPLMTTLFASLGLANTFFLLGAVYFFLIFVSSQYIELPPENWMREYEDSSSKLKKMILNLGEFTLKQAIQTKRFYYLWLLFFINICSGISLISVAAPMAQDYVGLTAVQAATMVGLMGLFNGGGRIVWASLSDSLGRAMTFSLFFVVQLLALLLLTRFSNAFIYQFLIFVIISCYGGGFSVLPAFLNDIFGTKELGVIMGVMLTAWALGGFVGPALVTRILTIKGSYAAVLPIYASLNFGALFVAVLLFVDLKKNAAKLAN